ncbi:BCCT family transporter [Bacteroides stercorirosoris]|jgi:BCCT family betaine/carnitine transporter|uniref:BCCT family transporter n=1 Tax=Bacteroides stercorirosoris TaxID=871324 RepID=A0A1M6LYL6_9BACE|nr:BCCT family transporter [Bacteroides stercorirosoris]RGX76638.1 BCCT family transporter [Bacteroides stercorirosoris]SHJ76294.1 betaine/carnitine transporter, BCCT family [Bacteroides stercorirosoris]
MKNSLQIKNGSVDWMITFLPFGVIVALCVLFFLKPEQSNEILGQIRFFFGDTFGTYYLIIGLGFFLISLFIALSKYGNIVLGGREEKPKFSFFSWGAMMFTCGLAADILFYSFAEWVMYADSPHIAELGNFQDWAGVFPIYHWSFIPWSFYLVLAVSFGFMLHVRKRERQKFSEACRPILGKYTDGIWGRIIDLLAVFALLAGTATTFSVATPLMASIINELLGIDISRSLCTIIILLLTCMCYTYALLHGFKGISILAKVCIYMFFGLLLYVLLFGGRTGYIIDTGVESLGRVVQNFIEMSTYTDPLRTTNFPQDWTIYYWAYWMVWCVAAPFFIGSISRGRTIRQIIFGGYLFGVGSTIISFVVLGNYSMGLQVTGMADFISLYQQTGDLYGLIISIIDTIPCVPFVLILVVLTMIAFYATSFDSIALTASCYSYRKLNKGESPHKLIQLLWCVLLILLPIALVFADSSMSNLQTVSIVAAFPLGIVMVLIIVSFLKDAGRYLEEEKDRNL